MGASPAFGPFAGPRLPPTGTTVSHALFGECAVDIETGASHDADACDAPIADQAAVKRVTGNPITTATAGVIARHVLAAITGFAAVAVLVRRKPVSHKPHYWWPKAGAVGDSDGTARGWWGAPLPLLAREPVRSRRGGKQLWTPAFALQVDPVAENLVMGGISDGTAVKYNAGFRNFCDFTSHMVEDTEEKWPTLLDGTDKRREEATGSTSSPTEVGSWASPRAQCTVSSTASGGNTLPRACRTHSKASLG